MTIVQDVEFKVSTMLQKGLVAAGVATAGILASFLVKKFNVQLPVDQQAEIAVAVTGVLSMLRNLLKQKVSWLAWL